MATLTPTELFQGVFSLIYVVISITVGIKIMSRYFEFKKNTFLLIGTAWLGLSFPWLGDVINFLLYLAGQPFLTDAAYLFIINAFLPFFVILWVIALTELLETKRRTLVILITLIIMAISEIVFIVLFFVDLELYIGSSVTPFQYNFGIYIDIFFIAIIIFIVSTGVKFAWVSIKSGDKLVALKGKLLILAFILFTVGALMDSQLVMSPLTVVIVRSILIASSFSFYMGFILPKWAKKIFRIE